MDRVRGILYLIAVLVFFDLLVLFGGDLPALGQDSSFFRFLNGIIGPDHLIGTVHPDVVLSPLILLSLAAYGWFLTPASHKTQKLIVSALVLAAVAEFFQKGFQYNAISVGFGGSFLTAMMAMAAAGMYLLYLLGFLAAGTARPNVQSLIPFGIVVVYCVLLVVAIKVPSDVIWQAAVYLPVMALLVAVSFLGVQSGDLTQPSLLRAAGVVTLLVSDSLRAISVFKFQNGSFLWSELLIMATFFAGQFLITRSIESDA